MSPARSKRPRLPSGPVRPSIGLKVVETARLAAEEGLSNQEIAERLVITERTARFHLTSIFNKLGADNRAQAVAVASQRGLL